MSCSSLPGEDHRSSKKESAAIKHRDETLEQFTTRMRKLLDMEHEAEKEESSAMLEKTDEILAARKGIVLLHMKIEDIEGGLLGKTLVTLRRNKGGTTLLPAHSLSQHDIVRIRPMKASGLASGVATVEGVVYKLLDDSITVAVESMGDGGEHSTESEEEGSVDDLLGQSVKVEKIANHVTYTRLSRTLDQLGKQEHAGARETCGAYRVLFMKQPPRFVDRRDDDANIKFFNHNLDESQKKAVIKALASQDVSLIHGPPGTGKTTTLVEYIRQEVARGSRVLACAGSNVAVDNIVEGLIQAGKKSMSTKVVRIGHPARMLPQVLEVSLEYKVLHSDQSKLARECREEIKQLNRRILKLTSRKDRDERRLLRQDIRYLSREERKRQRTAVDRCLAQCQVLACTLTGAASFQVSRLPYFDVVVIDEAAQSTEPSCWSAMLRGKRCVLGGDHLQLPPTIISSAAAREGLSVTLFERLHALHGSTIGQMLVKQYRMNEKIMTWSSEEMYGGRLVAAEAVAALTLKDLPVLFFIDTAGCDMEEQREDEGESLRNPGEAEVVMKYVSQLASMGIPLASIGIITPYSAQVNLLRSMRKDDTQNNLCILGPSSQELEISTVDGFQGREKDVIIISMVRSGTNRQVGFLSECRRMNVAITRAKKHVALIGDSETISCDKFLARLVNYFDEHAEYDSAGSFV
jgi:ATP-dependent RNA/DNA helicase IGHMBP2